MLFAFQGGWFNEKMAVYKYFLSLRNLADIFRERARIQASRRIRDKDVIKFFSGRIWYEEIGDAKLRLINPLFDLYWKIVKSMVVW